MSLRWALRSKNEIERLQNPNALFGIVQGGMYLNLREESLQRLVEMDFPGYAVGGVSVGEPKDEMLAIMAHTPHRLPRSEEHTSELQSLMRISYAVFCLK